jgi:Mce-associated membrane protein
LTEQNSAGIDDPGAQERPRGRVSAPMVRVVSAVLAVLLVAGIVAVVVLSTKLHGDNDRDRDRAAAVSVAEQFALRVDNFNGKSIDKYGKDIQALLTTKFKGEFDKEFAPFKEVFTQAAATGTGKILVSAVGSADDDSATVLVAHDALVKSKLGDQERHNRWSVSVVKIQGKWRIDDFSRVS